MCVTIAALEMAKEVVLEVQTTKIPTEGNGDDTGSTQRKKDAMDTMQVRLNSFRGCDLLFWSHFGHFMAVTQRMEQTAPENYARVSRGLQDLLGGRH